MSETLLEPERGEALLAAFRGGDGQYTREHAWLELSWWTGARMGSLRGLSKDVVADRVNATIEVIERHYDQARQLEEFQQRRAAHLHKLGIDSREENT